MTSDELETLYRSVGRCIWHIQYLEDALHTLLTLKIEIRVPGNVTAQEAQELLSKHRRATLGTALGTASKHEALHPQLLSGLRHLKEERDWLVHRSMHQDGDSLYTDEGRKTVFKRLDLLMETTLSLKKQMLEEAESFCAGHGISSEEAERQAREQIAKLKGDA